MTDDALVKLLQWIQTWGIWLSWLAWFTVFFGAIAMGRAVAPGMKLRPVRRAVLVIGTIAVIANLADYLITFHISPDLSFELNPIGNNIYLRYGLTAIKIYGLTGKLLVSIIAGEMAGYYVFRRQRLYPATAAATRGAFLRGMGTRSKTLGDRYLAFLTMFSFFFAGLSFFYFYVAGQNLVTDPAVVDKLPSVPVAISVYVLLLGIVFVEMTYRAYRKWPVASGQCPEQAQPTTDHQPPTTAKGAGK